MLLRICQICKKPFLAVKENCPDCPQHSVWDRQSRFNSGCLTAMKIFPFALVIFFLAFFLISLFVNK